MNNGGKRLTMILSVLFVLLSFSVLADETVINQEVLSLEQEFKALIEKENERFKLEEANMEASKKRLERLYAVKEKIEVNIANQKEERAQKFFKDDFDKLLKTYQSYQKRVEKEIVEQEKVITDFELIKQLRGE